MLEKHRGLLIRNWEKKDRTEVAEVIKTVLEEYGLSWQPELADRDVLEVEFAYLENGGEFWIVENEGKIVGTAAYYPIERGIKAVEIRKMYLLPIIRGKGVGKYLLDRLEKRIKSRGFREIWLETASILKEAVILYEKAGYQAATGVETARCDRVYVKTL